MSRLKRILCALFGHQLQQVCATKMVTIYECYRCQEFIALPHLELLLEIEMAKMDAVPFLKEMARKDVGLDKGNDPDE